MLSASALCAATLFVVAVQLVAFTGPTSASEHVATVMPQLQMAIRGASTLDATGFVPGDRAERLLDLSNPSAGRFGAMVFRVRAPLTGMTDGSARALHVSVERCSGPWRPNGNAFTCAGTRTTILGSRAVQTLDLPVTGLHALYARGLDHLRITIAMPASATNRAQGVLARIRYYFSALG